MVPDAFHGGKFHPVFSELSTFLHFASLIDSMTCDATVISALIYDLVQMSVRQGFTSNSERGSHGYLWSTCRNAPISKKTILNPKVASLLIDIPYMLQPTSLSGKPKADQRPP